MNSFGIYFGPKVISIVETKKGKVINTAQIPQPAIPAIELEDKISTEVKLIEIIALFKSELRKAKIEAGETTLCLSGKDLIIRTFEMPELPREELRNAINYEAKKYIPFKVEDLISDFQLEFDKLSRTNLVLFMGIKKETLDRYISILSQLNIKINAIEYSAFSILRVLRLTGASDKGIAGVLGADFKGEDEINFTVLANGFPLFSRDISVSGGPQDFGKTEETDRGMIVEKLKTELRVSLDYYHRKFPAKNIKKMFLVSSQDYRSDLEGIMSDIGLSSHFVDVSRIIKRQIPYSLSFVKGYSSSLSKTFKTKIKLNVLGVKKAKATKEKAVQLEVTSLIRGLKLDLRALVLGLLICAATFGFGLYRIQILRNELNKIISMRSAVIKVSRGASYEELTKIDSEYKGKLGTLDNLIKNQLYLTEPLNIIAKIIPTGAWLNEVSFVKKGDAKADLNLQGVVYLADSEKELGTANTFLSNLKTNRDFAKYFKEINIVSLDRAQIDEMAVTVFLISCKSYQGKK